MSKILVKKKLCVFIYSTWHSILHIENKLVLIHECVDFLLFQPTVRPWRTCDDAGFADEGVGERGLAVVHVGNHRHVTDVPLLIHDLTDLVDREVHHLDGLCLTVPMK